MQLQFVPAKQVLEVVSEFAPEYLAKDSNRKKEAGSCVNPPGAIRRQATGRNHTMHMWMMLKVLSPGMENSEEPNLGAEVSGIGRDLQ